MGDETKTGSGVDELAIALDDAERAKLERDELRDEVAEVRQKLDDALLIVTNLKGRLKDERAGAERLGAELKQEFARALEKVKSEHRDQVAALEKRLTEERSALDQALLDKDQAQAEKEQLHAELLRAIQQKMDETQEWAKSYNDQNEKLITAHRYVNLLGQQRDQLEAEKEKLTQDKAVEMRRAEAAIQEQREARNRAAVERDEALKERDEAVTAMNSERNARVEERDEFLRNLRDERVAREEASKERDRLADELSVALAYLRGTQARLDKRVALIALAGQELPFWDDKAKNLPEAVRALTVLYREAVEDVGKEKARADGLAQKLADTVYARDLLRTKVTNQDAIHRAILGLRDALDSDLSGAEIIDLATKQINKIVGAKDLGAAHPIRFEEGRAYCGVCAALSMGILPRRTCNGAAIVELAKREAATLPRGPQGWAMVSEAVLDQLFRRTGLGEDERAQYLADLRREYDLLGQIIGVGAP